MLVNVWQCNRT